MRTVSLLTAVLAGGVLVPGGCGSGDGDGDADARAASTPPAGTSTPAAVPGY